MEVPLVKSLHASALLVDVLDPKVSGLSTLRIPLEGEINTFRGLLDWNKRKGYILVPTIYKKENKTHGVDRMITPTEMGLVMDLPVCRTEQMKESDLGLLTDYVIPGKVVQSAIHFLSNWDSDCEQPSSVKRLMEEAGDGNQPVTKRVRKEHEGEVDIDIEFFDHEDEHVPEVGPSQKATKGDDAGVPVYFWDDRIQKQLTGHWAVKENLKGIFLCNLGRNFDKAADRRILKRLLEALR